jgi:hypothetical protein
MGSGVRRVAGCELQVAGQEENQRAKIKMQKYKSNIKEVNWVCFFAERGGAAFDKSLLVLSLRSFGHSENWVCLYKWASFWVVAGESNSFLGPRQRHSGVFATLRQIGFVFSKPY